MLSAALGVFGAAPVAVVCLGCLLLSRSFFAGFRFWHLVGFFSLLHSGGFVAVVSLVRDCFGILSFDAAFAFSVFLLFLGCFFAGGLLSKDFGVGVLLVLFSFLGLFSLKLYLWLFCDSPLFSGIAIC